MPLRAGDIATPVSMREERVFLIFMTVRNTDRIVSGGVLEAGRSLTDSN